MEKEIRSPSLHNEPRILHLISSLRVGGAERLLANCLHAARATGFANFVIIVMNDEVDSGMRDEVQQTGYCMHELARKPGHIHPRFLHNMLRMVRKHEVDIIHTHNDGSSSWAMALKTMRPRLKLVHTLHSTGVASQLGRVKLPLYRRFFNATVAISPYIEKEANALGLQQVTCIANGINLKAFAEAPPRAPHSTIRVANVGRFAHVKGQDVLIEAIRLARLDGHAMEALLAGVPSEPEYYAQLQCQIANAELYEAVEIVLNPRCVAEVLSNADIFVLPSRAEGFGLAMLEAMAAGLPVIAPRTGGVPDLVVDGENGLLFTPGDAADLARTMVRLANDSALQNRLSENGRATAQKFDISHTVERHFALYRQMAAQR